MRASMQEPNIDSDLGRGVGPWREKFDLGIKNFEKYIVVENKKPHLFSPLKNFVSLIVFVLFIKRAFFW